MSEAVTYRLSSTTRHRAGSRRSPLAAGVLGHVAAEDARVAELRGTGTGAVAWQARRRGKPKAEFELIVRSQPGSIARASEPR